MTPPADVPLSRVRPEDTATELKCVVVTPIVRYLDSTLGSERAKTVISETGMNTEYLLNPDNWISNDYFRRLLCKLVEVTRDRRAPFVAARQCSDMGTYGFVARFLKQLVSPRTSYRLVVNYNSLWNKISRWSLIEDHADACVIRVQFMPPHRQDRNNCMAIQGSLAALPRNYGLPFAKVEELECACEGKEGCVYRVTWTNKPSRLWGVAGALVWLLIGLLVSWFTGWVPGSVGWMMLLALAGYFAGREMDYRFRLRDVYAENEQQAVSLLDSIRAIENLNQGLQQKVEQRTAELSEANARLEQALKDLRDSQEKIIMSERQAAVGVLAAGMAHEMNNPMNAIRLSLQALREDIAANHELAEVVETATRATSRCSRIVSDLLSFSREPQQITPVALRDILAETVAEFRKEHAGPFFIATRVEATPFTLQLDRAQLKQALTNILSNAFDAMEGKGEVEVSLRRDEREAVLSIADRGPGIDPSLIRRVFDPFFTTKKSAIRKGTGLGLSIAYQLVQRNGGTIEVSSKPGCGATFVLRFPFPRGGEGGESKPGAGVHA